MSHQIDRVRWSRLPVLEQLGNISSEVGRSLNAQRRGDEPALLAAKSRAIDLFEATITSLSGARANEIQRAQDQYLEVFEDEAIEANAAAVERYFAQYALAARRHR